MNQGHSDTKRPPPLRRNRSRRDQAAARLGNVVADKYRLDEVVGLGGTGAVYRAEDVTTRRTVAVKILFPDAEGFALLSTRMEREAVAGTHLRHPNIAAAFDSGALDDDARWIAVDFVSGRTLRDVVSGGPVATDRATRIAIDLAKAIGACHARGVIHRDIKPLNVMIEEGDDTVKLIDFGLARIPAHDVARSSGHDAEPDEAPTVENLTVHGIVFGTVAYMAPETAQGMAAVDARSDLYAFGVLLYELFTGVHPFATKDPVDLFLQHRVTPAPPMRERAPDVVVAPAIEAIVMRLLAKRPADRFQDAGAVEQALREAGDIPMSTREPMPTPTATVPPSVIRVPTESRATDLSGARAPSMPGFGQRSISLRLRVAGVAIVFAAGGWLLTRAATRDAEDKRLAVLAKPLAILQQPPPPRPVEPPPGAAELATFRANVDLTRWQASTDALRALLAVDRRALTDEATRALARQTAMRAAYSKLKGAPQLFDSLAEDSGLEGIELLYEIVEGQGGSRAAKLAWERLERPAVQKRASRAIQIALELRMASCKEKPSLFARAEAEGDERARRVLAIHGSPKCLGRQG
ncbi:MAG: serine/threonine protein kinase, partial [Polyangiaceae bacterium]|nr:serine/threonine protein kinase [Polyangiaceae bacterium]